MLRTLSPQQLAYEHLRGAIVSGQLPGGTRLKSESIAETLGVSRMPVRDALRQLDAEGFVTLRPNRGAVVTNLTSDDILELFEMRAVLEGLAARLATAHVTPDIMLDLEADLDRLARVKHDYLAWVDLHDRFHDRLCALSGRDRLCAQITKIREQIRPYIRLYAVTHIEPELVGYEHSIILKSLESGNADLAERVMRDHVMRNGESIVASLKEMRPDERPNAPGRPSPAAIADRVP